MAITILLRTYYNLRLLFLYMDRNNEHIELGELIKITSRNILIKERNGKIISILRNGRDFQNLTDIPF